MTKTNAYNLDTATLPEAMSYAAFVLGSHHGIDGTNHYEAESLHDLRYDLGEMVKDLQVTTRMAKKLAARLHELATEAQETS